MTDKLKMAAIGDSITYGYPFGPDFSWLNFVEGRQRWTLINRGICGDTTEGMLKRFSNDVIAVKPDYTFILGGTNDVCTGVSAGSILKNIAEMIKLAVAADIKPVIGIPIPCVNPAEESILQSYRLKLYEYIRTTGIVFIDFYTVFQAHAARHSQWELYVDELHPSKAGYRLMGKAAGRFFDE